MRLYHVKFKTIAWKSMEAWICARNLEHLTEKLTERYGEPTIIECEWEG